MQGLVLRLQDPLDPESVYLLEALLEQSVRAHEGAGAFAWATALGVRLLLRDPVFENFVENNRFGLIVGVDAVTNTNALDALSSAQDDLPGLSVRIFASESHKSLFHPKLAWFMERDGGALFVGSGNLTNGGLRGNWEAYTISSISLSDLEDIRARWEAWLSRHEASLHDVDDPFVRECAESNNAWILGRRGPARGEEPSDEGSITSSPEASVLIAEIPRAGDRWQQANFDVETYEGFFGARVGTQRRILLQHVTSEGALGEVESRPSVEVRSRNFRFELEAAWGLDYPSSGRPIAVFLGVRPRTFIYRLSMPSTTEHDEVTSYLEANWVGPSDRIRRLVTNVGVVRHLGIVMPLLIGAPQSFGDE